MTADTSPRVLGELVALVSRASDTDSGAAAVLHRLRVVLRADLVVVELRDDAGSRQVWTHDGVGAARRTTNAATAEVDLVSAGARLGALLVYRTGPLTADERLLVCAVADLLAVAVARDARARELQTMVSARVREIAEQRAFIECVVDSLPVGLYVVDREYRIHAWNHKRETGSTGVSRTEAIGRTIFDVLHRQPTALLKREFDEVFASGKLQQFQMDSSAFGEPRSYRISKIPMRMTDDAVTHVITIGEDVTEWKAAIDRTAQSEKLAALGQLAAGVMHEINNPLATIAACAESLTGQVVEGGQPMAGGSSPAELLRIIDLEVQRCTRIVNGLLDFSRPKTAQREPVDLNSVVRQGLFLVQHHPRYKRVKMHVELEVRVPLVVEADSDQLVQVLIALAMNAMEATPEGLSVTVRTQQNIGEDGTTTAVLDVVDEGPGIPRSMQSKVFEPFFTTKPPGQGTGLGLAICYGIVMDHGGQLALLSGDAGATFRVSLPFSTASQGATA